jgi:hypothetical protein
MVSLRLFRNVNNVPRSFLALECEQMTESILSRRNQITHSREPIDQDQSVLRVDLATPEGKGTHGMPLDECSLGSSQGTKQVVEQNSMSECNSAALKQRNCKQALDVHLISQS